MAAVSCSCLPCCSGPAIDAHATGIKAPFGGGLPFKSVLPRGNSFLLAFSITRLSFEWLSLFSIAGPLLLVVVTLALEGNLLLPLPLPGVVVVRFADIALPRRQPPPVALSKPLSDSVERDNSSFETAAFNVSII